MGALTTAMIRSGAGSKVSAQSLLLSGAMAAFAAAAIAVSGAGLVYQLTRGPSVQVNLRSVTWWKDLYLKPNSASVDEITTAAAALDRKAEATAPQAKVAAQAGTQATARATTISRRVTHRRTVMRPAAHRVASSVAIKPVQVASVPAAADTKQTEQEKLRNVFFGLRNQFHLALNTQPGMNTQYAELNNAKAAVLAEVKSQAVRKKAIQRKKAVTIQPTEVEEDRPAAVEVTDVGPVTPAHVPTDQEIIAQLNSQYVAPQMNIQMPANGKGNIAEAKADENITNSAASGGRVVTLPQVEPIHLAANSAVAAKPVIKEVMPPETNSPPSEVNRHEELQKDIPTDQGLLVDNDDQSTSVNTHVSTDVKRNEYSEESQGVSIQPVGKFAQNGYSKTGPVAEEATEAGIGPVPPQQALRRTDTLKHTYSGITFSQNSNQNLSQNLSKKPGEPAKAEAGKKDIKDEKNALLTASLAPTGAMMMSAVRKGRETAVEAVEAFDWLTPVSGTTQSTISNEGSLLRGPVQLKVISATQHLPTIFWALSRRQNTVPLVSNNAAVLLSKLAGATLQAGTGIVFGKLPDGYSVSFSGRAERVLLFNRDKQLVSSDELGGVRYFAYVNVAPGAHLVHLTSARTGPRGAIPVLVAETSASYVDLAMNSTIQISGRVLDASSMEERPLGGINVRVVGQPGAMVLTDSRGYFRIRDVVRFGDAPLFIETEGKTGYTHRYKAQPGSTNGLVLFRLTESQIQDWTSQLEGGISSESGLIIAALPNVIGENGGADLFPKVQSFQNNATLMPETYTITSDGAIQEREALEKSSPKFMAVQVPEGPVVASLEDRQQNVAWSDFIVSSPGVVNVIGP